MTSKVSLCAIYSVFGYPLKQSAFVVGITSMIISVVIMLVSLTTILSMMKKDLVYNTNSMNAINLIFALFCTSTSLYQAAISSMLLGYTYKQKGPAFVLTLWVVSHISLLTLYSFMFLARAIICYNYNNYMEALFTTVGGLIYEGLFIYFCIIVNSYENTIEPNIIYY